MSDLELITVLSQPFDITREFGPGQPLSARGITRQSRSGESFMTQSAPVRNPENDLLGVVNGVNFYNGALPLIGTHYIKGGNVRDFGEDSTIWASWDNLTCIYSGLRFDIYRDMKLRAIAAGFGQVCPPLSTIKHPSNV